MLPISLTARPGGPLPGDPRIAKAVTSRRTPHSGYHYDGRKSRFFEGWYFKVAPFSKGLLCVNPFLYHYLTGGAQEESMR